MTVAGAALAAAVPKVTPPRTTLVGMALPVAPKSCMPGYPDSRQGEPEVLVMTIGSSMVPAAPLPCPTLNDSPEASQLASPAVVDVVLDADVEVVELEVEAAAPVVVVDRELDGDDGLEEQAASTTATAAHPTTVATLLVRGRGDRTDRRIKRRSPRA